jgi:two-component system, NarL family, invasion response regulator UvrY
MKTKATSISVVLVDDHAVVREGYRRLLERADGIKVIGEAASAAEAYQVVCRCLPDVVVMDISLPDVSGIEAMRRVIQREPKAKVLIFSIHDDAVFPDRAFRAGARGYVTKASAPDVLVDAVRGVAMGALFLSPDIARTLAVRAVGGDQDVMRTLSDREFEIVRLLAQGHSVRRISELLCLNYKTVANYQSAIRQKLRVESAVDLIRVATRSGMVMAGNDVPS